MVRPKQRKTPAFTRANLKRVSLRIRIKQKLDFFRAMDELGILLEPDFEHWNRGPVTLVLRDPGRHAILTLTSREFVYIQDGDDMSVACYDLFAAMFGKIFSVFKREKFEEVRLTSLFAKPVYGGIEKAFAAVNKSLISATDKLLDIIGEVSDSGHKLICKHASGNTIEVNFGPLTKPEWFQVFQYNLEDPNLRTFSTPKAFTDYQATFPDSMVFFDFTHVRGNVSIADLGRQVTGCGQHALQLASKVSDLMTLGQET